MYRYFLIILLFFGFTAYSTYAQKGKLFIIGGGKRPPELVKSMIETAELNTDDPIIVLPMASSEPDTSAYYGMKQFTDLGQTNVDYINFDSTNVDQPDLVNKLAEAKLIYITGGDQTKFMGIVLNTDVHRTIDQAYRNGTTIAGTSAGAAVMSEKMITGNEFKHPEYTGEFRTIEADNIEITEGLGLTKDFIVDQHFVWRMRMNRLISVAIEHPGSICAGIDESTALIIHKNKATVVGTSQVILLRNNNDNATKQDGLLGAQGLILDVILPGQTFIIDE